MTALDLNALMNMRGAGNAQKELIKARKWKPFLTDTERLDWLDECDVRVKCPEKERVLFHVNNYKFNDPSIRDAIDAQALKEGTAP